MAGLLAMQPGYGLLNDPAYGLLGPMQPGWTMTPQGDTGRANYIERLSFMSY